MRDVGVEKVREQMSDRPKVFSPSASSIVGWDKSFSFFLLAGLEPEDDPQSSYRLHTILHGLWF